jgi:ABC-type glycerol-3-phosphate transport system substrate-binding protein
MTPDQFMNRFWPALHGNARVDGKIYGVAFHNSTPLLYHNTDAFKEVGLDPDHPPQTSAEWADAADDAKVALDQLAFAKPWFATANTVAVSKALEDEVQQVFPRKKRPAEALKAAHANQRMKPYVDETALKVP